MLSLTSVLSLGVFVWMVVLSFVAVHKDIMYVIEKHEMVLDL